MILLTGATGYIGQKLLKSLIESNHSVIVPIRSKGKEDGRARMNSLGVDPAKVTMINADLDTLAEAHMDLDKIEMIVHNAALTAFNIDEESANKVNREGSRKVFALAGKCPNLKKIVYVSTVYSSGMKPDIIEEAPFDKSFGFANHYERSKWEAEMILMNEYAHLPWCIARVATIISDDHNGSVIQQNAVHNTLKLFFYGLISLLPGNPNTPIYLVTGEFVTSAMKAIIDSGETKKIYHVCHEQNENLNLGQIIDRAYNVFLEDEGFKGKRILKPLFTDLSSFETLVDNVKHFGGAILSQGVTSVAPFGKQLFIPKKIKNDHLVELMNSAYPKIAMDKIVDESCRYLVRNRFATAVEKTKGNP